MIHGWWEMEENITGCRASDKGLIGKEEEWCRGGRFGFVYHSLHLLPPDGLSVNMDIFYIRNFLHPFCFSWAVCFGRHFAYIIKWIFVLPRWALFGSLYSVNLSLEPKTRSFTTYLLHSINLHLSPLAFQINNSSWNMKPVKADHHQ